MQRNSVFQKRNFYRLKLQRPTENSGPPSVPLPVTIISGICMIAMIGGFALQIAGIDTGRPMDLGADGSLRSQIVLSLCYLVAILLLISSNFWTTVRHSWPVFILPLLGFLSMLWSPDALLTLRKSVALSGTVLFGIAICSKFGTVGSLRLFLWTLSSIIVASFVWVFVFPYQGVHQATDVFPFEAVHAGSWRGVIGHRTALGQLAALSFVLVLFYGRVAFTSYAVRVAIITISLVCLYGANSGAAYAVAGFMPVLLATLMLVGRCSFQIRIAALPFLTLALLMIALFGGDLATLTLNALGKEPDLTGRVPLWGYLIGLADQRPLLGYGLAAGFTKIVSPQIEGIGYGQFLNAHNGFMEILISFGYVGLALCLALLAWQFWIAARLLISGDEEKSHINAFPLAIFIYMIGANVVESAFLAPNSWYAVLPAMAMVTASSELSALRRLGARSRSLNSPPGLLKRQYRREPKRRLGVGSNPA
jgi:exopolysaccharide production protein ExoQ